MVLPSPRSLSGPYPQQSTGPATRAHANWFPAPTLVALVIPETVTGVAELVSVPSPSAPSPPKPQHFTVPAFRTAHDASNPTAAEVTVHADGVTDALFVAVLDPFEFVA